LENQQKVEKSRIKEKIKKYIWFLSPGQGCAAAQAKPYCTLMLILFLFLFLYLSL